MKICPIFFCTPENSFNCLPIHLKSLLNVCYLPSIIQSAENKMSKNSVLTFKSSQSGEWRSRGLWKLWDSTPQAREVRVRSQKANGSYKEGGWSRQGRTTQPGINICKDTESAWPILLFSKARVLSAGEGQEMQRGLYTKKKIKQAAMWSNLFLKESISVGVAPRGSGFPAKGKFLMDLIGLKEDEDERLG